MTFPPTPPLTSEQALAELHAGNRRFVTGTRIHPNQDAEHRAAVAAGQNPFAVVFGCSDSRLAAEIIFDRGLGDLFVVRTAGHVIGPEVLGTIEYAVEVLGTPLIVVLGHSGCGAVQAAVDAVARGAMPGGHIRAVVEPVAASVRRSGGATVDEIVDVHIRRTVDQLLVRSELVAAAVAAGRCAVAGMSYQLSAGEVHAV